MKKEAKFSKEDLTAIALRYANSHDTIATIAADYSCSAATISRVIKKAIQLGYVSIQTAETIRNKADENANLKVLEKGYSRSNKVRNSYNRVIQIAKRRGVINSEENSLLEEIRYLKHQIKTYNDTFSDSDEYGETIESLLETLEEREERLRWIQEKKGQIKN